MADQDILDISTGVIDITLDVTGSGGGGFGLPINYEKDSDLINRPQINSNELKGNKTGDDLGLQEKMSPITEQDIDEIMYGG